MAILVCLGIYLQGTKLLKSLASLARDLNAVKVLFFAVSTCMDMTRLISDTDFAALASMGQRTLNKLAMRRLWGDRDPTFGLTQETSRVLQFSTARRVFIVPDIF